MAKYCMKCGTSLPDEALFCSKCGSRQFQAQDTPDIPDNEGIQPAQVVAVKEIHRPALKSILILIVLTGLLIAGAYLVFLGVSNSTLSSVDYTKDNAWTNVNDWGEGYLNISEGVLRIYQTSNSGNSAKAPSSVAYGVWQAKFKLSDLGGCDYTRMVWYFIRNNNTYYYVRVGGDAPTSENRVIFGNQAKRFAQADMPVQREWHTLKITRDKNGRFKVFIDDVERLNYTDNTITISTDMAISAHRNCGRADIYVSDIRIGGYVSGTNPISVVYVILGVTVIILSIAFLRKRQSWWETVVTTKNITKDAAGKHGENRPAAVQDQQEFKKGTSDFYILGAKVGAIAGAINGIVSSLISGALLALMLPIAMKQLTNSIATSFGVAGAMFGGFLGAAATSGIAEGLAQKASMSGMFSGIITSVIWGAIGGAVTALIICFIWDWTFFTGKTPFKKALILGLAWWLLALLPTVAGALILPFGFLILAVIIPAFVAGLIGVYVYAKLFDRFLRKPVF